VLFDDSLELAADVIQSTVPALASPLNLWIQQAVVGTERIREGVGLGAQIPEVGRVSGIARDFDFSVHTAREHAATNAAVRARRSDLVAQDA
jgi:hypothetical protein